ncbi:class I SAM-dependent methyltransferase [Curtobacterium sp. ISL-83]|nr:class I SAM-dependent methyltransferase [Curtobacterium sp. ISL-83]
MASVHPSDVHLVTGWAERVEGTLLDAGCGPGHWTAHLTASGLDVRGIDRVPEFIDSARRHHPAARFELGNLEDIDAAPGSVGGILAWYSLIHHEPGDLRVPLHEFARVLRPGGELLVGFFVGPDTEAFDHAVTTAYRWSLDEMHAELDRAGFDAVETHTRTGSQPKPRPHAAVVARLRTGPSAPPSGRPSPNRAT